MNERTRRKFTQEFKYIAVHLVINKDYSCSEVVRLLSVSDNNMTRLVRQYQQRDEIVSSDCSSREEMEAELTRLRTENKHLEMERGILKKRQRPSLQTRRSEVHLYPAANEDL